MLIMPQKKTSKSATSKYKASDYQYTVSWSEEDQVYVGRVAEFSSLAGHGNTLEEALQEISTAVEGSLEDLAESGEHIPVPFSSRSYSGRLNLRMSEHQHRQLAIEAQQQGVSLNQWILTKLETPLNSRLSN
jgi:predicted HicB family RNase H-like nuclease